jgi:CLIP-associating protein 1/2
VIRKVLEATNTIRDMLTAKLEPVYGLTTMHASLKEFHAAEPPSETDMEVKAAAYAFGLIALGKFILRLPSEVAEEELPRMKATLISVGFCPSPTLWTQTDTVLLLGSER